MGEPSQIKKWVLSSPPVEWALQQVRELLLGSLRQGPIPQHIAFEMDGNRRFARRHKMETIEGHHHGSEALARILEVCYRCGVKTVTVYAFSIENFNRPKYEVDALMEMAKVKLQQLTRYGNILDRYGASVRVLGQRSLIRGDVLEVVDHAIDMTKGNSKVALNICFPYTSREEMTTAIRSTVEEYLIPSMPKPTPFSPSRITRNILTKHLDTDLPEPEPPATMPDAAAADYDDGSSSSTLPAGSPSPLRNALPNPESITVETLDAHMYTARDPPLDIFVRTSGVERLSDFMLWQCHRDTHIFFLECFWPELDLFHFLPVLLEWQWRQKQKARDASQAKTERSAKAQRVVA